MSGPENGNFPLLYVMKMSLHRGLGSSRKPQNPLRNIKMVPYCLASLETTKHYKLTKSEVTYSYFRNHWWYLHTHKF